MVERDFLTMVCYIQWSCNFTWLHKEQIELVCEYEDKCEYMYLHCMVLYVGNNYTMFLRPKLFLVQNFDVKDLKDT